MALYAVTAKPVLHSLSPALHRAGFEALGLDHSYTRLAADSAAEAIELMREIGIAGLNISSPFKEEMAKLVDVLSDSARELGAVNTVIRDGGKLYGFNTDIDGVAGALAAEGIDLPAKRALVLGSGGAARAAIHALNRAGCQTTQWARRGSSEEALEHLSSCAEIIVSTIPSDASAHQRLKIQAGTVFLNADYANPQCLRSLIHDRGGVFVRGEEWLIHQAATAFHHFTGHSVGTDILRAGLSRARSLRPLCLIGLSGAGKSATGHAINERGKSVVELDEVIATRTQRTISAIFAQDGERAFRAHEGDALKQALIDNPFCVVCGGGTVVSKEARDALRDACPVWLWSPPSVLAKRLAEAHDRPLLRGAPDLAEALREQLDTRRELYASVVELIIRSESLPPHLLADRIIDEHRFASQH